MWIKALIVVFGEVGLDFLNSSLQIFYTFLAYSRAKLAVLDCGEIGRSGCLGS